jgi:hypothetical protein
MIDDALGGPWDALGKLIKKYGEDSSGLRRTLLDSIRENDRDSFSRLVPASKEEFTEVRKAFIDAWGPPPNYPAFPLPRDPECDLKEPE